MCGIAGFFTPQSPVHASKLEAMAAALVHRGPDDDGFTGWDASGKGRAWKKGGVPDVPLSVGLAFRRLAILDLSSNGAQPMSTEDGRFHLVFNGQIYNYVELRRELTGSTSSEGFRSTSDTEVLLRLLARWGTEALGMLDGMFAFALYDAKERTLTLARDPLGIKPLYWTEDKRGLFFASEIRALATVRETSPALRVPLVARFLANQWIADPDTLFEGIHKVEPGQFLMLGGREKMFRRRYWDLSFRPDDSIEQSEWEERLDDAIDVAVQRQLRSDVPVGFFLSGGVDSSLLTAKAAQQLGKKVTAFTIGFRWKKGKALRDLDLKAARVVAKAFPIEHREILIEPSVSSLLPEVVRTLEEPIADAAALCSYLICREAAGQFKVLISGQGADELFGGYPIYQAGYLASMGRKLPDRARLGLLNGLLRTPYSVRGRPLQLVHKLRKTAFASLASWPESFTLLRSALRPDELEELLVPDVLAVQEDPFGPQRSLAHGEHSLPSGDEWQRMMYLDTKTYLPALNLAYSDKTSMASSIELRVPFLDREILDLVQAIPSRYQLDLLGGKKLLKQVAAETLPNSVVYRRKAGFGVPLRDWFADELQPMAAELLSTQRLRKQGLFNPAVPARWLKEHRLRHADHAVRLFALVTFQLWCDAFDIR